MKGHYTNAYGVPFMRTVVVLLHSYTKQVWKTVSTDPSSAIYPQSNNVIALILDNAVLDGYSFVAIPERSPLS